MATPTNGTGNLVDEFEESFQILMTVLAKEEENYNSLDKEDSRVDIDQSSQKFLDVARQVESFFLQKRFVLSVLKPELIVKEEIVDLKAEILRKDELLKRHHEKLSVWQRILDDMNMQHGTQVLPSNQPQSVPSQGPTITSQGQVAGHGPGTSPNPATMISIQQLQQQQMHMQQQQQQHLQQQQIQQMQQQMSVGIPTNPGTPGNVGSMLSPQQASMFMQQGLNQQQRSAPFPGQTPANMLNPLAFLEKTTSNIGRPEGPR